ncbi:MAG: ABC transporter [Planctomycetales bacterium 4572_13]|nr:MAG: ABC transporter [Planctomycetales bacterium 4572_13]
MSSNKPIGYPPLHQRLYSVWYRHLRVYTENLFSNAFPPFFEPLIFLAGVGLGLGRYIDPIDGRPYVQFLAIGLLITSSMWTAFFECTFGTFIRMEFQKVYDGMLAAPITANNLIVGEMLWAASKGLFFSFAVLCMLTLVSLIWPTAMPMLPMPNALFAPLLGFFNALMFAAMALLITSFVKTINHFNFFMTGIISPMFFFSGVVFPVSNLPETIRPVAEILPLTHSVRIMRCICDGHYDSFLLWDMLYIVVFTLIVGILAIKRLKKRLIL